MEATFIERRHAGIERISLTGWSLVAGALLQIGLGIVSAPHQNPASPIFGLISTLNAASHLLLLVGVAGLLRSGAVGPGSLGRGGLALTLLGLGVLFLAEFTSLVNMELANAFFSAATIGLMTGLILAGIAMLRHGHWTGWRRYTPLACGLFIPVVFLPAFALPGYAANYAIGAWGVCWLLLGLAMRSIGPPRI